MLALAGALLGVVPDGVSAVPARKECRATAFVVNSLSATVSTIDVQTRTKNPTDIVNTRIKRPTDINVGEGPAGIAVTPDGKTVFVSNLYSNTVSTIDVKSRATNPTDITVGTFPFQVAVTPCRR